MASITLAAALALFGVVVLGLLALQLWWATKRKRRALQVEMPKTAVSPGAHAGAAAGSHGQRGERTEPTLEGNGPEQPAAGSAGDRQGPSLADGPDAGTAGPAGRLRAPRRNVVRLDALIDAIVPLALEHPISGDLALAHLPTSRRAGSKAFAIEGLDVATGRWDVLTPGSRYGELQAGVQLASRSGALNDIEYSEFMQKLQAYAEAVGASVDGARAPDMLDAVARARELDALTGALDAQLTITLRTNSVAWSVAFVQQVASRLGFVPGLVPGRMVLPTAEDGAPPMLVLAMDAQAALAEAPHASAIRACTLTLDVPQTAAIKQPFPAWRQAARRLGEELDATLCDDHGQAIGEAAFAEIGHELEGLYQRLAALDLPAGSAAARRLFS
jgi:hypothetical protein